MNGIPSRLSSGCCGRGPANADIGQARAAFFPQVSLTGSFGYQSTDLGKLFTSSAQTWQFVPSINLPIFTGGRLQANADLAEAAFDEAVANYGKTVQNAFREVSDALVGYQRLSELRERQKARAGAYRDATRLANLRYEGGVTSYFEVLNNEQEYFNAEIALAQAARNEVVSLIQLYKALGGGAEERETVPTNETHE